MWGCAEPEQAGEGACSAGRAPLHPAPGTGKYILWMAACHPETGTRTRALQPAQTGNVILPAQPSTTVWEAAFLTAPVWWFSNSSGHQTPARGKWGGCQRGGLLRRQVPRSAPTRDSDRERPASERNPGQNDNPVDSSPKLALRQCFRNVCALV